MAAEVANAWWKKLRREETDLVLAASQTARARGGGRAATRIGVKLRAA